MATDFPAAGLVQKLRGWPLFLLGVLVFFAGPAAYAVQVAGLRQTVMPWAMLALTSVGVVLMALSLVRYFSVLRTIGCIVFLTLTGLQWAFFLVIAKSPTYTGPARTGAAGPLVRHQTRGQSIILQHGPRRRRGHDSPVLPGILVKDLQGRAR